MPLGRPQEGPWRWELAMWPARSNQSDEYLRSGSRDYDSLHYRSNA
jgi:hypothetical protein